MQYRHEISEGAQLEAAGFHALAERAAEAASALLANPSAEAKPLLTLPERQDDLAGYAAHAERLAASSDEVWLLGTGGSSLGAQTLISLAGLPVAYGSAALPGRPRLRFLENVDPAEFAPLLAAHDPRKIGLVVVSKSGSTMETMAQALILLERYQDLTPAERAERVLVVTEPKDSPLSALAERLALPVLPHDPDVGGRFSIMSVVGMLPCQLAGLDAAAVRAGAASVTQSLRDDPARAAPVLGAAYAIAMMNAGRRQQVLLTYADRLTHFGMWYRQLWAESLGKEGLGQTPIRAMGTVDQHSQVQLYLDGPDDKCFTALRQESEGQGPVIPQALASDPRLDYLSGRRLGDLFAAEARATADVLEARGKPMRRMTFKSLDAPTLGALLQHFILETILGGALMGVSPFGQPAVELGKVKAKDYLKEMT